MSLEEQARLRLLWPQRGSITLGDGEPPTVPKASKPFLGPTGVFSWDSNALVAPQVNKATKPYLLDAQNRPVAQRQGRRGSVETSHTSTFANLYMARNKSAQPHIPSLTRTIPANVKPELELAHVPRKVPLLRKIQGSVNAPREHR